MAAARRHGIVVSGTRGAGPASTAELTWGLIHVKPPDCPRRACTAPSAPSRACSNARQSTTSPGRAASPTSSPTRP
ncbi:hypothetical protein ABZ858_13640 [Streptomyces sp. NPDC047017]|uniref:hypothetical protein n=1 Tax=Streptomyces sp. NPDC047017 TaxID=3155024 RepID=UPI0033F3DE62